MVRLQSFWVGTAGQRLYVYGFTHFNMSIFSFSSLAHHARKYRCTVIEKSCVVFKQEDDHRLI
ncbi:hypothetical protein BJX99DRAFT_57848 [Aspergillus californicus]